MNDFDERIMKTHPEGLLSEGIEILQINIKVTARFRFWYFRSFLLKAKIGSQEERKNLILTWFSLKELKDGNAR